MATSKSPTFVRASYVARIEVGYRRRPNRPNDKQDWAYMRLDERSFRLFFIGIENLV